MNLYSIKLFIFLIFVIILPHNSISQCVKSTPCTCIKPDGMGYDITSLQNEKFISINGRNVTFQPCKNVDLTFEASQSNRSDCHLTSLCMLNSQNDSVNLGVVENSSWELVNDNNPKLIFRHTVPDKKKTYETTINLNCCPSCTTPILIVDSVSETKYNLTLVSHRNCLTRLKMKGLSTGSVLVILLCVFSGLYFIGGALALKVFRGAVGLELIPNYDFWSELPGLVRDGVTFTFSGCTAVSYDRI